MTCHVDKVFSDKCRDTKVVLWKERRQGMASGHLVEHQAEAVNITSDICRLASQNLWGDVAERATNPFASVRPPIGCPLSGHGFQFAARWPTGAQREGLAGPGKAKVADFQISSRRDQDIGGLDVPVGLEALAVGVFHPLAELDGPLDDLFLREATTRVLQIVRKTDPTTGVGSDKFHDDEETSLEVFHPLGFHD